MHHYMLGYLQAKWWSKLIFYIKMGLAFKQWTHETKHTQQEAGRLCGLTNVNIGKMVSAAFARKCRYILCGILSTGAPISKKASAGGTTTTQELHQISTQSDYQSVSPRLLIHWRYSLQKSLITCLYITYTHNRETKPNLYSKWLSIC